MNWYSVRDRDSLPLLPPEQRDQRQDDHALHPNELWHTAYHDAEHGLLNCLYPNLYVNARRRCICMFRQASRLSMAPGTQ